MTRDSPRKIGPYLLDQRLGRGGMGEVWRGEHLESGTVVAIKFARVKAPEYEARIAREAQVQAKLEDPNIVRILDVIDLGGSTFIVMEYIDGKSLYQVLRRDTLTDADRADISTGLFCGLSFAHRAGVLHRDLKPSNIMMSREEERWVPQIADFGIAREMGETLNGLPLTQSGVILGTPGYMAPEQIRTAMRVDERADIFALGCILYQLYTGQRAFRGADSFEMMRQSCDGDFRCPLQVKPDLSPRIVNTLEAALAPHKERRPKSVAILEEIWKGNRSGDGYGRVGRSARVTRPPDVDREQVTESAMSPRFTQNSSTVPLRQGELSTPPLGRDQDSIEIAREIRECALVTLLGPGGIGKTRLAKWVGLYSGLVQQTETYFCDLTEATTPAGVFGRVAAALSVPLFGEDAEDQLVRAIRGRGNVLLVLDNAEQVTRVLAAIIRRWMGNAPDARFLVTSRIALGLQDERRYEVTPLTTNDAALLFERRARKEQRHVAFSNEDRPVIRQIVERLDCIPLAIELAAPWVALLPLKELLMRLDDRFRLLKSNAPGTAKRALSMRAAIDGSWKLLQPWEKLALAQVSVFRGGFELDAAESVLSLDHWPEAPWVMDVIHGLVRQSLLRVQADAHDQRRLRLYESIREYAAEKMETTTTELTQNGESLLGPAALRSLERCHAEYYAARGFELRDAAVRLNTALIAGDNLLEERENITAALDTALNQGATELAATCALALARTYNSRGPILQGIKYLNRVIEAEGLDDHTYAKLTVEKFALALNTKKPDFDDAPRVIALPDTDDFLNSKALVLNFISVSSYGTSEFRAWTEKELARRTPLLTDGFVRSRILHSATYRALRSGDIQKGIELATEAKRIQERCDDVYSMIRISNALGACYMHSGLIDVATMHRKEALALAKDLRLERLIAMMELNLGWHAYLQEDYELAENHNMSAIETARRIGAFRGYCWGLANLSMVHLSRHDYDLALAALRKAKLERGAGNSMLDDIVRRRLALALARSGQIAEARKEFERYAEDRQPQSLLDAIMEDLVRAELEFHSGEVDAAQATLEEVESQVQEHSLGDIPDVASFLKGARILIRGAQSQGWPSAR